MRRARNLPNQRRTCFVALGLAEPFADAVRQQVALQHLEAAVKGAELRGGLAVEVEDDARDDLHDGASTSGTRDAAPRPLSSETATATTKSARPAPEPISAQKKLRLDWSSAIWW